MIRGAGPPRTARMRKDLVEQRSVWEREKTDFLIYDTMRKQYKFIKSNLAKAIIVINFKYPLMKVYNLTDGNRFFFLQM